MTHLATWPGCALAVKVDRGSGNREPLRIVVDLVPDQVRHGDLAMADGFAERPSSDRANMLLELRDRGAVQRPVPGIVHPWGDLVDPDLASTVHLHHEHLDREHADVIERVCDTLRDVKRLRRQLVGYGGRGTRYLENVIPVLVFGDVEAFDLAVGRARSDHRNLALEWHERLEDRELGAEVVPDLVRIIPGAEKRLPLAVIAEAARLEHRGQTDFA